jgi:hypothetical protein
MLQFTFDSVEPPLDISTPIAFEVFQGYKKNATSTVSIEISIEIHKGAIFDRLKIKESCL